VSVQGRVRDKFSSWWQVQVVVDNCLARRVWLDTIK